MFICLYVNIIYMIADTPHQTVTLSGKLLTSSDILLAQAATQITFENCASEEWPQIAETLGSLQQLHTLTVIQCPSDSICKRLYLSKTLLRLRIGTSHPTAENCGITEREVK